MQYFKPEGETQFVGDCMPFFHDGVFHLFWLLDEGHHQARGGLGCHRWAHSTTTDLVQWEHHPLAIPITAEHEGSICTGSVFHHEGVHHAYYATRYPDWSEHLSLATSTDGIRFEKTEPNPFASPGPEFTKSFRDPHVFRDPETGLFHLIVTTSLREPAVVGRGGCLAQFVSEDLHNWRPTEPLIVPGYPGDPECPDYIGDGVGLGSPTYGEGWNGWYYLIFSNEGIARYRMSRRPLGPWLRPKVDVFDGPMARVLKTAAFTGDRRLGVAFLPSLQDNLDEGAWLYGGSAVFREIIQHEDGSLGTKWPEEMIPTSGEPLPMHFEAMTEGVSAEGDGVTIAAPSSFGPAMASGVPLNVRVRMRIEPQPGAFRFGLCVRGSGSYEQGYEIRCSPNEERVEIRNARADDITDNAKRAILDVEGLDRPFSLDVLLKDDIIDVCLDERRTLVARCLEQRGDRLFLFAHCASVVFREVSVGPL
ncbi:MAG: hypothetical protein FJX75_09950 [Armatimonadetes bacterium]|nr:hypothetical protein [Armatimonadota bacterium]